MVIGFANGLPIYQVTTAWAAMKWKPDETVMPSSYWSCSASPLWAPLEILFGFSYLFLFGAGFYLGPACIMIAGALRVGALFGAPRGSTRVNSWPIGDSVGGLNMPVLTLRTNNWVGRTLVDVP